MRDNVHSEQFGEIVERKPSARARESEIAILRNKSSASIIVELYLGSLKEFKRLPAICEAICTAVYHSTDRDGMYGRRVVSINFKRAFCALRSSLLIAKTTSRICDPIVVKIVSRAIYPRVNPTHSAIVITIPAACV